MKPTFQPSPAQIRSFWKKFPIRTRRSGFALVITMALMVLLMVLAVGLLSLSSIEIRSSGASSSMAQAKANARLALMLAIGELQKQAGPDQRITARSDIRQKGSSQVANARLTGVWNSWEIDANSPPSPSEFDDSGRDAKFLGWLASSSDPASAKQLSFVDQLPESPVVLWDKGTLGDSPNTADIVRAGKVDVASSSFPGAYAWAVMDEGIKARINTPYQNKGDSIGERTAELGAGVRPGTEFIPGLDSLKRELYEKDKAPFKTLGRGISPQTFQVAADSIGSSKVSDTLKSLTHDVTPWSLGLFTDTARGGLKQDFSLLTSGNSLPNEYAGTGLYASVLKMTTPTNSSDPSWAALYEYATLDRKVTNTGGVPSLKASVPNGWTAAAGGDFQGTVATPVTVELKQPQGLVLMPVIDKVQMLFSLVGRDYYKHSMAIDDPKFFEDYLSTNPSKKLNPMHGFQDGTFGPQANDAPGTFPGKFRFGLEMLYTPIITLHNPYNVALQFDSVRIDFAHVPFALKVYTTNGDPSPSAKPVAQTTRDRDYEGCMPMDIMHSKSEGGGVSQAFGMTLYNKVGTGSVGTATFTLLPGETKLFSPYADPTYTWQKEFPLGAAPGQALLRDYDTKDSPMTKNLRAIPGFRPAIGFDLDWFVPSDQYATIRGNTRSDNINKGRASGVIALSPQDKVRVEFRPRSVPNLSKNKFTIRMSAVPTGGSQKVVSAIEIDYQKPTGLEEALLPSMRQADPQASFPLQFPRNNGTFIAKDIWESGSVQYRSLIKPMPFCLLSVQAKTTLGGQGEREDGRWATKPFAFAHASAGASTGRLGAGGVHPANHAYEFDFQALPQKTGTPDQIPLGVEDRSNGTTAHTAENGIKFSVQNDVPLTPLQSFATLNGANPGGSSGYGLRFAQPIGNSWAHPLLSPQQLKSGDSLDHSFLMNLALYDRFYFSGLAAQTGVFGSGKSTDTLANNFSNGVGLDDPRLLFSVPPGKTKQDFAEEIKQSDAYKTISAWQMMEGSFNVNSTSVNAWKAMLASIHGNNGVYNRVTIAGKTTAMSDLGTLPTSGNNKKVRISRFRLPNAESAEASGSGDEVETNYWLGAREYDDKQLELLARNIVEQIQERGPFLSMADFVNRRLGTGEKAERGALQQAIDNSNLNRRLAEDTNAGYEIPKSDIGGYGYVNPDAAAGSSYQGGPGYLTQADLLSVLGNAATPRSDTFTVRAYGEARDASGRILATAVCEAVVQRFPDWVDSADRIETAPKELASTANKTFGRRMQTISFRWLHPNEI
jgi:hypothetical protein